MGYFQATLDIMNLSHVEENYKIEPGEVVN